MIVLVLLVTILPKLMGLETRSLAYEEHFKHIRDTILHSEECEIAGITHFLYV